MLARVTVASIGLITSRALAERGVTPTVTAGTHHRRSLDALVILHRALRARLGRVDATQLSSWHHSRRLPIERPLSAGGMGVV